jgi:hypothetical protein
MRRHTVARLVVSGLSSTRFFLLELRTVDQQDGCFSRMHRCLLLVANAAWAF